MALDGPPAAEANATAEHAEAGGDFDAAMTAAIADDTGETEPEAESEPAVTAETEGEAAPPKAEKPKKEEPAEEESDGVKLRSGFRALARDRAKLREREATATAELVKAKTWETKAAQRDEIVRRLHEDPAALIREAGGDELLNKLLDGIVATEKSPAEREVAKMRAELERRDADGKAREQQAVVDQWKATVRNEVTAQSEAYDLVNSLGQHDAVIATIEAYYVKYNGAILPVADAAQAVEDTLAKGLAKSKKFGAREPVKTTQPVAGKTAPSSRKAGSVTLSSVHSSELPSGEVDDLPLNDANERFNRLMASINS